MQPSASATPVPAVVIYGGVSLAIYINGVVQEMLRLVRATAVAPDGQNLLFPNVVGSEKIYRMLGQLLGGPDDVMPAIDAQIRAAGAPPVHTRFVIDILSGTSAGGINAVFLAKALANNASLDELQTVWVQEGDIGTLINDKQSLDARLDLQRPPQSLLNGRRMYLKLLEALDAMDGPKRAQNQTAAVRGVPLVEKLDLFCTATDLKGLPLPLPIAEGIVEERRHRNVFRFRYSGFEESTVNHFTADNNPFLAFAARCTSAFPFAFEPMALGDIFPAVQSSVLHRDKAYCSPQTEQWQHFYRDYVGTNNGDRHALPFAQRAFGDGGYLDNKPFSYAIATTLERQADLPIDRKLVYVEPNPDKMRPASQERPDAIENSLAALVSLPRYETIREDLETVIDRNFQIERVNRVVRALEGDLAAPRSGQAPGDWMAEEHADTLKKYGPGYLAYERLKVSSVTDDLGRFIVNAFEVDPKSCYAQAIRYLAGVWRALDYATAPEQRQFLLEFDVTYRLRRLRHVKNYLNERFTEAVRQPSPDREYLAELGRIRTSLGAPHRRLQALFERSSDRDRRFDPQRMLGGEEPLATMELELVHEPPDSMTGWPGLDTYPGAFSTDEDGLVARARYVVLGRERSKVIRKMADFLHAEFKPVLIQASDDVRAAFQAQPGLLPGVERARQEVRERYDCFERHDSITFPILFGVELGEGEPIDVHRISPDDAQRRSSVLEGRHKLRGQALGAFGAFLDATWRKNDILWGRLDGAERLISILLPGNMPDRVALRARLVDEAHAEIVKECLGLAPNVDVDTRLRQYLATDVRNEPDPTAMARAATRATTVTGELLSDVATKRHWTTAPYAQIAMFGRLAWGLVEVSAPRTLWELLFGYWVQVILLVSVGMLGVGWFFSGALLSIGWKIAGAATAVWVAREFLRRYLARQTLLSNGARIALSLVLTAGLTLLLINSDPITQGLKGAWEAATQPIKSAAKSSHGEIANELARATWAALLVTLGAGYWTGRLSSRVKGPVGGPRLAGLAMQFVDRWEKLAATVGDVGHAARAELRKALNADYLFIGGYAALFAAYGSWIGVAGDTRGWFVLGAGLAAAAFDVAENRAIVALLALPVPEPQPATLPYAPRPRAMAKWVCALVALALVIGVARVPPWNGEPKRAEVAVPRHQ